MRSHVRVDAGRWLRQSGMTVLLVSTWACATDTPVSPDPTTPGATPAAPTAPPNSAGLTLSRPDVVLNAVAGATASDSATISVTATPGVALMSLEASIRYHDGQPVDWLTVLHRGGDGPPGFTLRAQTGRLAAGEYRATVLVQAPGAAAESLSVTARVVTTASIGLNAAQICLTTAVGGPPPRKDDVRVTSVDGSVIDGLTATIAYDAGQPTGWLTATFDGTTAPARLWLESAPGTLPAGIYTATVNVASPRAGNSPVPIRVTLTLVEPALSLLRVHIVWEGPQNGGLATIWGQHGIHCQGGEFGCVGYLESGVGTFSLSPDADWGARFLRWEGACAGQAGGCTVTFATPGTTQEATAVFGTRPSTLSISLRGPGASGTVSVSAPMAVPGTGAPVTCRLVNGVGERCDGVIETGAGTFTVTATPDPGSIFAYWQVGMLSGDRTIVRCVETTPTCTITMTHGASFVDGLVTFAAASARSVQVQIEGPGLYVTWMGIENAPDCPTVCTQYFAAGTMLTLRATAQDGATFVEWIGCPAPSGTTCVLTVADNIVVRARFQ